MNTHSFWPAYPIGIEIFHGLGHVLCIWASINLLDEMYPIWWPAAIKLLLGLTLLSSRWSLFFVGINVVNKVENDSGRSFCSQGWYHLYFSQKSCKVFLMSQIFVACPTEVPLSSLLPFVLWLFLFLFLFFASTEHIPLWSPYWCQLPCPTLFSREKTACGRCYF